MKSVKGVFYLMVGNFKIIMVIGNYSLEFGKGYMLLIVIFFHMQFVTCTKMFQYTDLIKCCTFQIASTFLLIVKYLITVGQSSLPEEEGPNGCCSVLLSHEEEECSVGPV